MSFPKASGDNLTASEINLIQQEFGGDGSDGVLTVSSGTTNLNLNQV